MKFKEYNIDDRIERSGWSSPIDVNDIIYVNGLMDVLDFVLTDIRSLLEKENRYYGIMKSYSTTIRDAYSRMFKDTTPDEIEIYGRILYVFKLVLKQEYRRMTRKGLSAADAGIVISHKMIGTIIDLMPDSYPHKKEIGSIKKVLDHVWDNIRHRAKGDAMIGIANLIRRCHAEKIIGRYPLDDFHLASEERIIETLVGDGTRLSLGDTEPTEIEL